MYAGYLAATIALEGAKHWVTANPEPQRNLIIQPLWDENFDHLWSGKNTHWPNAWTGLRKSWFSHSDDPKPWHTKWQNLIECRDINKMRQLLYDIPWENHTLRLTQEAHQIRPWMYAYLQSFFRDTLIKHSAESPLWVYFHLLSAQHRSHVRSHLIETPTHPFLAVKEGLKEKTLQLLEEGSQERTIDSKWLRVQTPYGPINLGRGMEFFDPEGTPESQRQLNQEVRFWVNILALVLFEKREFGTLFELVQGVEISQARQTRGVQDRPGVIAMLWQYAQDPLFPDGHFRQRNVLKNDSFFGYSWLFDVELVPTNTKNDG
jgi:hypothetical protein